MVHLSFRVLLVLTPAFDPNAGGVQMSTYKMARCFSAQGHSVSIFSFSNSEQKSLEGCNVLQVDDESGPRSEVNLIAFESYVRKFAPDIVINQMPYEHEIGEVLRHGKNYLLLGCLRNTLFSVIGDLDGYIDRIFPSAVARLLKNPLGRAAIRMSHRKRHSKDLRRILDTYDHFVMFGPPNLEELRYFVPDFHHERVRLVPNSIPTVVDSVPSKENRILWLGRVENAQKRADLIPAVWRSVSERLPDWHLDVVGDGADIEALKAAASEMKLPRIHFHSRQVPDGFYRDASIFFMTSAFEGFPNTLVEAQSYAAVPVVFDSYPVASWIVDAGESGELIRPFDTSSMAACIVELATDLDRRHTMAKNALESARRFRIENVGAIWQALFEAEVPKHIYSESRFSAES